MYLTREQLHDAARSIARDRDLTDEEADAFLAKIADPKRLGV